MNVRHKCVYFTPRWKQIISWTPDHTMCHMYLTQADKNLKVLATQRRMEACALQWRMIEVNWPNRKMRVFRKKYWRVICAEQSQTNLLQSQFYHVYNRCHDRCFLLLIDHFKENNHQDNLMFKVSWVWLLSSSGPGTLWSRKFSDGLRKS